MCDLDRDRMELDLTLEEVLILKALLHRWAEDRAFEEAQFKVFSEARRMPTLVKES